jgi:hypothetical protein
MSMKRSKPKSSRGSRAGDDEVASIFAKPTEKEKTYEEWTAGQPDEAFAPYSMKTHYSKGALLTHPKFGKGVVVGFEGAVAVVLFAEGPKKLGHAPG